MLKNEVQFENGVYRVSTLLQVQHVGIGANNLELKAL